MDTKNLVAIADEMGLWDEALVNQWDVVDHQVVRLRLCSRKGFLLVASEFGRWTIYFIHPYLITLDQHALRYDHGGIAGSNTGNHGSVVDQCYHQYNIPWISHTTVP
jgi:hypothetical protein